MTMEYKGYRAGPIDFDAENGRFFGVVLATSGVIHFEGRSAKALLASFRERIDAYLALCAERGEEPDRPFSGELTIQTEPVLHRKAAIRAAAEGISLNQWISRQIEIA